ncbi:MAG: cupin-like domain-containing protein [Candidatus Binatia bacterium]|nr:cupin-like domain-containing protein [Candidatus Binatia bacterium]
MHCGRNAAKAGMALLQPAMLAHEGTTLTVQLQPPDTVGMPRHTEVPRVDAVSAEDFRRLYLRQRKPVVLRGLTVDWSPPAFWTFDSLAERYGDALVVAALLSGGTLKEDPRSGVIFERILLRDFMSNVATRRESHYVMAPVWNFPVELKRHYRIPVYCQSAPYLRAKLWLGRAHTVTPLHWDVPHNLIVQLVGRKRWLLFPRSAWLALYPRGLLSGMANFSRVDPEQPDLRRFPRFRSVQAFEAIVEPGETLFIPRGWWHHTRLLNDAVSLNFWWGGYGVALAARASLLFKRLRRIRQNEWA